MREVLWRIGDYGVQLGGELELGEVGAVINVSALLQPVRRPARETHSAALALDAAFP